MEKLLETLKEIKHLIESIDLKDSLDEIIAILKELENLPEIIKKAADETKDEIIKLGCKLDSILAAIKGLQHEEHDNTILIVNAINS